MTDQKRGRVIASIFLQASAAVLLMAACTVAMAQAPKTPPATTPTLVVGVKVAPPFVVSEGKQQYSGLAIDLWEETAADHDWDYVFKPYGLDALLDAVDAGEVDVGLGAITATAEREQRMDFAHPITSSGLGVAVRNEQRAGWLAVARALVSPAFLKVIGTLALLLLLVGVLAWLLEHKRNPDQFGGSRAHGIFSGFWWAMVTMTTVGYGDIAPRTVGGRVLGLVWMLIALLVVSFFTASITSSLTVGQLSSRIRGPDDLASMRVASMSASTSGDWLQRQGINYINSGTLGQALQDLAAGRVEAVVYDAPLLRWETQQHYRNTLTVLPFTLERQDYAFALPNDSPLREAIDTSLLQRINSPAWNKRLEQYFGKHD